MNQKKLSCGLLLVILSTLPVASSATTELTFWSWRLQEQTLWERVNAEGLLGGDLKVNFQVLRADDYDSLLLKALQEQDEDAPDIFHGRPGANWLDSFVEAKVLEPLPPMVGVDLVFPAAMSAVSDSFGQVYGIPFAVQLQSVIYNKRVFTELGVQVPKSLDELEQIMERADAAGLVGMAVGARSGWWNNQVLNEVLMAGMVSDDYQRGLVEGTSCFTEPAFVDVLTRFKSWQRYFNPAPAATDYTAMRAMVATGEAAMMIDGAWSTSAASPMFDVNPDVELGFFAIPGTNARAVAHPDGGYLINANSPHREAAYSVMQLVTTQEFAEIFAEEVGEFPAIQGLSELPDDRMRAIALTLFNTAAVEPFVSYALNSGEPGYPELVASGYQQLLYGNTSPQELARAIQAGLNSWNYVGSERCAL